MFFFYKILTSLFFPFLIVYFFLRIFFKKETFNSFIQKIFINHNAKNFSKLFWFHGSSIGEVKSVFPLIKYYLKKKSDLNILITSSTLSSKKIIDIEFSGNKRVIHKFLPLDTIFHSKKFLKYWKPKAVFFIDSEIWPNFISKIKSKKIPLILLNGRTTEKTFKRWKSFSNFHKKIFSSFDLCVASSEISKQKFQILGIKNVKYFGNLKFIFDETIQKETVEKRINVGRKCWLAASTHEGEEEMCLQVHELIKIKYPDILTIIIPRHIDRVKKLESKLKKFNNNVEITSDHNFIDTKSEILIVNIFGVLPKFYRNLDNVFIGKSMMKKLVGEGGQNPLEAIQMGCKVYHGPYVYNFKEIYDFLKKNNMSKEINNSQDLANEIINNFQNPAKTPSSIESIGKDILNKTLKELDSFL